MTTPRQCTFCAIVNRSRYGVDLDVDIETHGIGVLSFPPLNRVASGHRVFIPKVHVAEAGVIPTVAGEVFTAAAQWASAINEDYNLITSAGPAATQTVEHFHVHYVPRREGDNLDLPWTHQEKP